MYVLFVYMFCATNIGIIIEIKNSYDGKMRIKCIVYTILIPYHP